MLIILSKLLPLFVYPLGLAIILLLISFLVKRGSALRSGLAVLAVIILWLCSTHTFSYTLARSLEWQYLPLANVPNADVIVLLGGGTVAADPPRPTVELNGAGDRVYYAARLFKEGKAPHILLSGGNIPVLGETSSTPAQQMADILGQLGVPASALWLENQSQNTEENAIFAHKILQDKGINRILLVTSAAHMPRAVELFKSQGFDVIPAPTDYTVTAVGWKDLTSPDITTQIFNFMPNVSSLSLTTNIMKEYLGMLTIRLGGNFHGI